MKEVAVFLTAVADGLKAMSKAINGMAMQIEQMGANNEAEFLMRATKSNPKRMTASEIVYEQIKKRSKRGISSNKLVMETGFNKKKIHNSIFRLKQQGKVKSIAKGVYTIK